MNKKAYTAPVCKVVEIESSEILAVSDTMQMKVNDAVVAGKKGLDLDEEEVDEDRWGVQW